MIGTLRANYGYFKFCDRWEPQTTNLSNLTVDFLKFWTLVACKNGLDKQFRPRSDCFRCSSLIRVFPVCYYDKHFVNSTPANPYFIGELKEKSVQNIKTFTIPTCYETDLIYKVSDVLFFISNWGFLLACQSNDETIQKILLIVVCAFNYRQTHGECFQDCQNSELSEFRNPDMGIIYF